VPGAQSQAAVALHTARASIDRMAALLVSSFPLPKLDMVAIPDYPSGATEHWGLITFRETTLLLDEAASSRDIERVATVVAHEVAHSWFGNLVTMPWWTELWLNEGFASFWEYEGVRAAYSGWAIWDIFPVADAQRAMSIDLLTSALPLKQNSVRSGNLPPSFGHSHLTFFRQRDACCFQHHNLQQGRSGRAHMEPCPRRQLAGPCAKQLILPEGHGRLPRKVCFWHR
jgi:hypothetical protein